MPDTLRFPRIVFPDLAEHQLYNSFQPSDKNYILPSLGPLLIPFDGSYLDEDAKLIMVPITSFGEVYIRAARVHIWLEPSDVYPRGTRLKFNPFIGNTSFNRILYTGRYTIIPLTSWSVNTVAGGVDESHSDDMKVFTTTLLRMRISDKDSNILPDITYGPLPVFYGLVELV